MGRESEGGVDRREVNDERVVGRDEGIDVKRLLIDNSEADNIAQTVYRRLYWGDK